MNKHEIAFDQLSMAKQVLSKSEEESQNKENGNSRSMGCRIAKTLVRYIYGQERKKDHMYVLVVRGYRQLKTLYRYRQQMSNHLDHHHHHRPTFCTPTKLKWKVPFQTIRIKQRIN
jgi:hypothetical protein